MEKTLKGEQNSLKERTIGVEVFQRPANYDTGSDTVVRYAAGEVRKRLSLYYHEAGVNSPIHIELPAGSYVPEFYLSELERRPNPQESLRAGIIEPLSPKQAAVRRGTVWLAIALIALCGLGVGLWHHIANHSQKTFDGFWSRIFSGEKNGMVLICPGAVVFSSTQMTGVAPVQNGKEDPLISSETAVSISQLTDLLTLKGTRFILKLPPQVTKTDLRQHSIVLIGAYSNALTMQAMQDLRYRFSKQPSQAIYDTTQPAICWSRPRNWSNTLGNDYGLFSRVLDKHTGKYTVVIAGLGRRGTEAAASFVTSPQQMQSLASRLPGSWERDNLEVVLRTEVRETGASQPVIEAVWAWR